MMVNILAWTRVRGETEEHQPTPPGHHVFHRAVGPLTAREATIACVTRLGCHIGAYRPLGKLGRAFTLHN